MNVHTASAVVLTLAAASLAGGCSPKSSAQVGPQPRVASTAASAQERSLSTDKGDGLATLRATAEESLQRLKALLREHRRYSFWSRDNSYSGVSWEYRLDVEGNTVAARSYRQWHAENGPMESWNEMASDVGVHQGGVRNNLEQLYRQCLDVVLNKPVEDNNLYLTVDAAGALTTCVYVPKNCMDDCSSGVRVNKVEWH